MPRKELYPHQVEGADYMEANKCGFLFYKQRMGKTLTSIELTRRVKNFPVLIICPKIVITTWRDEFLDEGAKRSSIQIVDFSTRKKNILALESSKHVFIVNFEKIKNYDILSLKKWKVVIVDEIHRLANVSSNITRHFLRNRRPPYQRRYGLTGTPAPERYYNLVTQYLIVTGSFMGYVSYNKYMLENWKANPYTGQWEVKRKKHIDEIIAYVKKTACVKSMKDIGKGAKFVFPYRTVGLNKEQKSLIKKIRDTKDLKRSQQFALSSQSRADDVARLYEKMVSAGIDPFTHTMISDIKIKECVDYWDWYKEPLLVVSAFRDPIDLCAQRFTKKGAKVGVIHGDVSFDERDRLRKAFMEGKLDVIIAQTKSIEVGLNFSRADTILVMSNLDSGGSREQLVERINHMNATSIKQIIDIKSEGTNDFAVKKSLDRKGKASMSYFN